MKLTHRIAIAVAAILGAVILFKLLIGGSTIALFTPAGPIALQERNLIETAIFLMLIIVVPFLALFFTFAWRYRAQNSKAKYDPEQSAGIWKQLAMWAIPSVIIAGLAVIGWKAAHAVDPYKPIVSATPALTIEVVALEWKWLFIYPKQNIATVNFIEFPAGTPVHFELTADAPMSSFWIPQLGSQIYAMAAMETQINLLASTTGEFTGKDTEINGSGYAGMQFTAKSASQSDFDQWVQSVQASSTYAPLTADAYSALAATSSDNPPAYYSSVEGDMFHNIMMKFMAPADMQGMQM